MPEATDGSLRGEGGLEIHPIQAEQVSLTATVTAPPAAVPHPPADVVGEPVKWSWFGLDAGNLISLCALILSLGAVVWQASGFFKGPKIYFIPPTSVTFRYWGYGEKASVALTATTMNYANEGRKDYDGLLTSEQVVVLLPGKAPLQLHWWWFVAPDGKATEQAHPVIVPGAGLAAHETRFAPLIERCPRGAKCTEEDAYANFLEWEDFLSHVTGQGTAATAEIKFTSTVREPDSRDIVYRCRVDFDSRVRAKMAIQRKIISALKTQKLSVSDIEKHPKVQEYFSLPCTPSVS